MRDLEVVSKGVRSSSSPVEAFRCNGSRRRVVRGEGGSETSVSCPAMANEALWESKMKDERGTR
jgi:hypothetical protein